MNWSFSFLRPALLAAALMFPGLYMPNGALALAQHAHGAITTVADFDAGTWTQLLRSGPRPAAYVFTNSFCATCPEAFDALQKTAVASGKPVPLAAILMDVQGERALAHAHHYAGVTKICAFDGFEPAIRQAVDFGKPVKAWRPSQSSSQHPVPTPPTYSSPLAGASTTPSTGA